MTFFKEERERLCITQSDVAIACDVKRQTIGMWDKGQSIPSDKLAILAKLGFDISYIVLGERPKTQTQIDPKLKAMAELLEGLNESQRQEIYAAIEKEKWLNQLKHEVDELKQVMGKK